MTASRMESLQVQDGEGRKLGHVFDLACPWTPGEKASPIDELIFGTTGLLERVGLLKRKPASVPWSLVREVAAKAIRISPHTGVA